jgi:hypothetical protein
MVGRLDFSDERGLLGGFLIKLVIVIAVLGLTAADGASIFFARLRADDAATAGATACAVAYRNNPDFQVAANAAVVAANDKAPGVTVSEVAPTREGYCTVTTRTTATTLVVSKVSFMKKWGEITASETASPPTL